MSADLFYCCVVEFRSIHASTRNPRKPQEQHGLEQGRQEPHMEGTLRREVFNAFKRSVRITGAALNLGFSYLPKNSATSNQLFNFMCPECSPCSSKRSLDPYHVMRKETG